MSRDKIKMAAVHFVVGNLVTGRIVSEHATWEQAHDALVHRTERTGNKIYTRNEWETSVPDPYDEAKYNLERIYDAFEDLSFEDAKRVFGANPEIKHRLTTVAETLLELARRR